MIFWLILVALGSISALIFIFAKKESIKSMFMLNVDDEDFEKVKLLSICISTALIVIASMMCFITAGK